MSRLALIWAQDVNGILGTGTAMCWHVPDDFKHFKRSTLNSPVIMGRSSFEALGKALPKRHNIVLTRNRDLIVEGATIAHDFDEAVEAGETGEYSDADIIWITGGAKVYEQTIDKADELVVTYLDLDVLAERGGEPDDYVYAPKIGPQWCVDESRSDSTWREKSGDARWKVITYIPCEKC